MEKGFIGRIQRAMADRESRRLSHEAGHRVDIDTIPQDQEIVAFDANWLDNVARNNLIYNESVIHEEDPRLKPD